MGREFHCECINKLVKNSFALQLQMALWSQGRKEWSYFLTTYVKFLLSFLSLILFKLRHLHVFFVFLSHDVLFGKRAAHSVTSLTYSHTLFVFFVSLSRENWGRFWVFSQCFFQWANLKNLLNTLKFILIHNVC